MENVNNYSVDTLKKSAFVDELNNVLNIQPVEDIDENMLCVIEYFKTRIKEIDKQYEKKR